MIDNFRVRAAGITWCVACTLFVAWAVSARSAGAAEATGPQACLTLPRSNDEQWVVSTRAAGCGIAPLTYRKYEGGIWQPSDERAFLATKQSCNTTVFYVHGLAVTAEEAFREGWQVYCALAQCAAPDESIRFVLYSWPSNLGPRPLRSARSNQYHTDAEGCRLAGLLVEMRKARAAARLSLIGHSSGGRVVSAALESIANRPIAPALATGVQTVCNNLPRVVLVAPAADSGGLLPGRTYQRAISQVEQMLILFNPCDRVLRWYRFLERGHRGPEAVGYTGLASQYLSSADRAKVRQVNSSPCVGRHHMIGYYTNSPSLMAEVRAVVLFEN